MILTQRARARSTYHRLHAQAGKLDAALYKTSDPLTRAKLLDRCAYAELRMSDVHTAAFGPQPIKHEDGRDMAEALRSSATLLHLLGLTERTAAIAAMQGSPRPGLRIVIDEGSPTPEEMALWGVLAVTADRAARADLIDQIYPLAADRVGGQAAESLACQVEAERHLARTAAGSPHPYRLVSWPPPRVAGAVICLVAAALAVTPGLPALAKAVGIAIAVAVVALTVVVMTRLGNRALCGIRDEEAGPR